MGTLPLRERVVMYAALGRGSRVCVFGCLDVMGWLCVAGKLILINGGGILLNFIQSKIYCRVHVCMRSVVPCAMLYNMRWHFCFVSGRSESTIKRVKMRYIRNRLANMRARAPCRVFKTTAADRGYCRQ
jgi:hypothetical protein